MRTHLTWLRPTGADRRTRAAWPVALHLCIMIGLWGGPVAIARATNYAMDVDYSISGSSEIAPVQVFDDGQRTYIQFPNPARIPEVRIENAADHSVIHYQTMAPYIVLNQVVDRIILKAAGRTVDIAYNRYRAPTLAGLPAGRGLQPQSSLTAAQPLTAPVAFYAAERPHAETRQHKPHAHAAASRHAKGHEVAEAEKDEGPTAISVASAASLAPRAINAPALPPVALHAKHLPGMHGKHLPALPGNIATLPQLRPYKTPNPIVALNASPAPATSIPAQPATPARPAAPALPTGPILAVTGSAALGAVAASGAAAQPNAVLAQLTAPVLPGGRQETTPQGMEAGRQAATAMPATLPASAVHPGAPLAALEAAAPAPVQQAQVTPPGHQVPAAVPTAVAKAAPVATPGARQAVAAMTPAPATVAHTAAPAATHLAQAAEKTRKVARPAAHRASGTVPVTATNRTIAKATPAAQTAPAGKVSPATLPHAEHLALASAQAPVPALDVTVPGQAAAVQAALPVAAARPAKPPVRHDYEIQPGLLKQAFQQVVEHYGYTLAWEVNEIKDKYVFDYPVMMAGTSFIDDLRALENMANAPKKAFVVDVYQGNKIITVRGLEN